MANEDIGVKGWRNYSAFSLFSGGSQRADKNTSLLVDTSSGNLTVLATDWNLAGRVPISIARAYNHQDDNTEVDRPFGPGWYWQFDMNITGEFADEAPDSVTWKAGDGSEYQFDNPTGAGDEKTYDSPAGMHQYTLTYDNTRTNELELTVGRMVYSFKVNSDDMRARLMYIRDAFGNGIEIVRPTDGNSDPEATITNIQIRYENSGWNTQTVITPTYSSGLITQLDLKYWNGSSTATEIQLHYTYTTIDSEDRLTKVEPKDSGGSALNMEIEYDYNASAGLQMTELYDTEGSKAGTPYYWQVNYTTNQVSSIVFPIDSGDTGTVSYAYGTSAPTSWGHSSPNAWNKVTDANSNDWYYGQDAAGRVQYAVDPLWVNSSHESYTEYAYNSDNQVTSVKTPRPNSESSQLETAYYYNSDKNLAAVVDPYGFVSWYVYGSRASYSTPGSGAATVDDVIGIFTPLPNEKAYSDSDHTSSETTPPSLSSPVTVTSHVSWDSGNGYWKYSDGTTPTAKTIKLVRTVMDYTFATGTGQLTQLLTCSPENFGEGTATTYTLTTASGASKQEFDSTTGDLAKSYTPRQFQAPSTYKWTAYTYDTIQGVTTEVENADSVLASAGKKTKYTYNNLGTRVTKVQMPQDNTNQWTESVYDDREFLLGIKKPDIGSWSVTPQVNINEYDYNGNLETVYQADPAATGTRWDGNSANGYDEVRGATYDRLNRQVTSYVKVDWDQDSTVETLTSTTRYDDNGNVVRQRGPAYLDGATTKYSYNFTSYDAANRVYKSYVQIASTDSDLSAVTGGTKYTEYEYDLVGNTVKVNQPLYNAGSSTTNYATKYTYDWMMRQIKTSRGWTNYTPAAANLVTEQHFDSSGGVYWSQDGEGYKMYPEKDLNGRLWKMHRGSTTGDNDEREYDADGHVLYYYTFKDVVTDSKTFRTKNKYDEMGRLVNGGREEYSHSVWTNWNENTADATFNYNGAPLKSYDKVNTGKYTERVYDNWGQLTKVKAPTVLNSTGTGNVTYETENTYNVLGQRTSADDHEDNTTSYSYDLLGRVITVLDALSNDTDYYFDERGNRWKVDMPSGALHVYTYNDRNLLEQHRVTHDSTNDDTDYTYNDNAWLTQVDHPDGGVTKYEYDELGRKDKLQALLTGTTYLDTTYQYDDNSKVTKVTMPGSYHVDYTYDDLGNMTKSEDTNSDDTDYTYDKDNRRLTTTPPNNLVTTNTYDWKTGGVSNVQYELNATTADDINVAYTFDDNGRPTTINDGRGENWVKAYDAMGRLYTLTTPNPGSGSYTHTNLYDGNGNIKKTTDFKGTSHFYDYDALNRMVGHGADSDADDETYTWSCCGEMTAYTDSLGTASLSYDDLSRLTSFTDSNGNQVQYEYDEMGRTTKVTGPQGANYRTEYQYNKNGSLSKVRIYDNGSSEDTDYTYSSTSGKLTQRDFPTVSSQNIRTSYSYDSAGRLQYETVSKETGSTTNLYRTAYGYSYLTYGRQVVRTEQDYSGGWNDSWRATYQWDSMERQDSEEREDWSGSAWDSEYLILQQYDKNGNRTLFRQTTYGSAADYGPSTQLSYTYNDVNALTAIADALDADYECTVTCDANGNITKIEELDKSQQESATLTEDYTYDALNRLTQHKTTKYNGGEGQTDYWQRDHTIDAIGRTVKSSYEFVEDGVGPGVTPREHIYNGSRFLQNYDGTSTYGEQWRWAGAQHAHSAPVKSPNADTSSTVAYNLADNVTPQKRTFIDPDTEGDQRHLYGQGKPMSKDASGSGVDWVDGITSDNTTNDATVTSRFDFHGTVAVDTDRATDAREKGRIGIFGTANSYAGSYGRVTSERIGRDLNPLGRGDGNAYVAGSLNLGRIAPELPMRKAELGTGNSVINEGCLGCGLSMTDRQLAATVGVEHEDLLMRDPIDPPGPFPPHVPPGTNPPPAPPGGYWPKPWPEPVEPGTGYIEEDREGYIIWTFGECPGSKQACEDKWARGFCKAHGLKRNPCCGRTGTAKGGPTKGKVDCDLNACVRHPENQWCVREPGTSERPHGTRPQPFNCRKEMDDCLDKCKWETGAAWWDKIPGWVRTIIQILLQLLALAILKGNATLARKIIAGIFTILNAFGVIFSGKHFYDCVRGCYHSVCSHVECQDPITGIPECQRYLAVY